MTPPCGNLRPQPETSKNSLLVKTTLGTVKATTWDLPSSKNFQHEYGLRQHRDGITSADVIGGWMQHQGTGDLLPGRDFKTLSSRPYRFVRARFLKLNAPSGNRGASPYRRCYPLDAPSSRAASFFYPGHHTRH